MGVGRRSNWQTTIPEGAHPRIRALYEYWNAKRGQAPFPSRDDIDPVEIPRLLEFITLVEVRPSAPRFVYKVVGTTMAELLHRDPTGQPVGTGVKEAESEAVLARYAFVASQGRPVYQVAYMQEDRNDYTQVERLMLPLGPSPDRVNMILTLVTTAEAPRR